MDDISFRTASILLKYEAVEINTDKLFTLTSGKKSPVYINCRRLISFPGARSELTKMMVKKLKSIESFDVVAGGETAGIPYAAWLSEVLKLPMLVIRKNFEIDGTFIKGSRVLLVEDLASDGKSKIKFVNALRKAEAVCNHVMVLFHYNIFPYNDSELEKMNIKLHRLTTWNDLLIHIENQQKLSKKELRALYEWKKQYD